MKKKTSQQSLLRKRFLLYSSAFCMLTHFGTGSALASENYTIQDFDNLPISIVSEGEVPRVMVAASVDHQLYYKAYGDYTDLTDDGVADTTYVHSVDYYGYFDEYKCYKYDPDWTYYHSYTNRAQQGRFYPNSISEDKYCNQDADGNYSWKGEWSGNFLNWVSMARIDASRKILFGGHRRVDTAYTSYSSGTAFTKTTLFDPSIVLPVGTTLNRYTFDDGSFDYTNYSEYLSFDGKSTYTIEKATSLSTFGEDNELGGTLTLGAETNIDAETVLERTYLPHDAHSWAKHYTGEDIPLLTPFINDTDSYLVSHTVDSSYYYYCDDSDDGVANEDGESDTSPDSQCLDASHVGGSDDNRLKYGITLGNTTDVDSSDYDSGDHSQDYDSPPLIKVVPGNYSLWGGNETWQITWSEGSPVENQDTYNGNDPSKSDIWAYSDNPAYSEGLGEKDYVVRVQACVPGLIGEEEIEDYQGSEKCELYPGADKVSGTSDDNYKPVGLLHEYGKDQMMFGLVAGTYSSHANGGSLIRQIDFMTDEIEFDTDGTFPLVSDFAGGPADSGNNEPEGLINAWSLYRIYGYSSNNGWYGTVDAGNSGNITGSDMCGYNDNELTVYNSSNQCTNWGNPFSEIYYQAINFLNDGGNIGAWNTNDNGFIPGLENPNPNEFEDPLGDDAWCADMFIINFNTSASSFDSDDLRDQPASYVPTRIWDADDLPGDDDVASMTDQVGVLEGITGDDVTTQYYIGESSIDTDEDQLCTPKDIANLGDAVGLCPEVPRLAGSYFIAGLAYYAHTKDIRSDLDSDQTVDTYSVALASGVPKIEIPDPDNTDETLVTILPACKDQRDTPQGNCSLVEFKIVEEDIYDDDEDIATGKYYVNWEVGEQGGDYDQDMWGILEYTYDTSAAAGQKLKITTQVFAQSSGGLMAFGYVLGGTTDDGYHVHSGINGYTYTGESDVTGGDCSSGCYLDSPGSTYKYYSIGDSDAVLLEDPLWYAAKYGGFIESGGIDGVPDIHSEWDSEDNSTGSVVYDADGEIIGDGIPDNYFYATNPKELEESLQRVFNAILERTSSGTAAAVVSSNVSGEGAVYQAYYEPLKKSDEDSVSWIGTLQAFWLDSAGYTRQDCGGPDAADPDQNVDESTGLCNAPLTTCVPNGRLDNYCVDQVVETYYDEDLGYSRMKVYESTDPDEFSAYSMQGVVKSYSTGVLTVAPNSMEGNIVYSSSDNKISFSPYSITGTVTSYDATTGDLVFEIASSADWDGPDGETFSSWLVTVPGSPGSWAANDDAVDFSTGTKTMQLDAAGSGIVAGDTILLQTKNLSGSSGQYFSEWYVNCLDASDTTGEISGVSIKLSNDDEISSVFLDVTAGDFTACTRAEMLTLDMQGSEDSEEYSPWQVTNLTTSLGSGTSDDLLTLSNHEEFTIEVDPTSDWLSVGDNVLVSNYTISILDFEDVNYLWNAREELSTIDENDIEENRIYSGTLAQTAVFGRYITTWIDKNLNGVVDSGEYVEFEASRLSEYDADGNLTTENEIDYSFFDVTDTDEAATVINYVRGAESTTTRNRTIQYSDSDTSESVLRLGDIVNSTPTAVAAPAEAMDQIYYDYSYRTFRQKYQNRRIMIYAGGNDGLIHAFNGGFYEVDSYDFLDGEGNPGTDGYDDTEFINYKTTSSYTANYNEVTPVAHPLGSEVWAYAPYNLLTHLQWLKDPLFSTYHVNYMDLKPRVFDAKIFAVTGDSDNQIDQLHPNGWGTVMVVGMNLGGGAMTHTVNYDSNDDGTTDSSTTTTSSSAYVVFDVTDPELEPVLLGEIPVPDESFSTVYPAVAAFQDLEGSTTCKDSTDADAASVECNSWYLVFGNGPNDLDTHTTDQNGQLYMFDLSQLTTNAGITTPTVGATVGQTSGECVVEALGNSSVYSVIVCDTLKGSTYMGTPSVVDWELDYKADTAYFGLVGDQDNDEGYVMRYGFNSSVYDSGTDSYNISSATHYGTWYGMDTVFNAGAPVGVQIVPGIDDNDEHWIYFGTGRYKTALDKTSTQVQYLFGVKDPEDMDYDPDLYSMSTSNLLDVTDVDLYSDGSLVTSITGTSGTLDTFDAVETEIETYRSGWYISLPPIVGNWTDSPTPAATRNVTTSSLLSGLVISTVFQPNDDPCEGEGQSRLYAIYYKTGTAYPTIPAVLGTDIVTVDGEVKYVLKRYVDLGQGMATSPSIHSGQGSGDTGLKIFTQLSTGEMIQSDVEAVQSVRTGRESWSDR